MKCKRGGTSFRYAVHHAGRVCVALLLCLALGGTAAGQKKKKDKKEDAGTASTPILTMPDEQKLDYAIGEMLAAWQVGDIEKLHKAYAEDVSVVNGLWAPPVIGWNAYLADYQMQRTRLQQARMERSNTLIRIAPSGVVAWACYQWDFSGIVDGRGSSAQGHTTLIFQKRGDQWVIVHNHTSLVQAAQPTIPTNPSQAPTLTPKP